MEEKKSKTTGSKIRIWRKTKDLTQDALAKKAKIESDIIKNPSPKTVTEIAEGLEITLDELISQRL